MEGFEDYGKETVNLTQYSSKNKGGDHQQSLVLLSPVLIS